MDSVLAFSGVESLHLILILLNCAMCIVQANASLSNRDSIVNKIKRVHGSELIDLSLRAAFFVVIESIDRQNE